MIPKEQRVSIGKENDVLLTEEKKEDKRIYLPLEHLGVIPKIEIPIFINNTIKREYLFVDKEA